MEEPLSEEYVENNTSEVELSEMEWEQDPLQAYEHTEAKEAFLQNLFTKDRRQKSFIKLYRFSAAAIILLLAGGSVYYLNSGNISKKITSTQENYVKSDIVKVNTTRQKIQIKLPDLSVVILSPASEIKYASDFGNAHRELYLSGDAVFTVYKNTRWPFTVYCKNVATTALGTTFRVSEKSKAGNIAVTLMEGRIAVRSVNNEKKIAYYLHPGNSIYFNLSSGKFSAIDDKENLAYDHRQMQKRQVSAGQPDSVDINQPLAGKAFNGNDKVYFKNAPLSKVLDELARTYNVEIVYPTKKVAKINFIGAVPKTGSLEKVLMDVSSINDFKLIIDSPHHRYVLQ